MNSSPIHLTKPFRSPDHIGPELIIEEEIWVDILPPPIMGSLNILPGFLDPVISVLGNLQFSVSISTS